MIWYGLMDEDKRMRFITLFNPDLDPTGSGYQQRLGTHCLGSGKLWGKGNLLRTISSPRDVQ